MAASIENPEEDDYDSEADEDFNPDAAVKQKEEQSSSSDEDGDVTDSAPTQKRKKPDPEPDFDNSGDEATISKARKKRRKQPDDEDEAGEGGLVKTRAQRKAEGKEKKPIARADASKVDVNELWAQMSGGSTNKPKEPSLPKLTNALDTAKAEKEEPPQANQDDDVNGAMTDDGQISREIEPIITIKRTYEFAGQQMEESKSVPASSAEAKLYLEEQARPRPKPPPKPGMRRPMKRASMFDAAPTIAPAKGTKLNTVEKSKLDWAAHVDQVGMADELDESRRAKGGYLGRMDFLSRMDAKREEELQSKK